MRIQAFLTAAAVNLKRLAAALLALLHPWATISVLANLLAAVAATGARISWTDRDRPAAMRPV